LKDGKENTPKVNLNEKLQKPFGLLSRSEYEEFVKNATLLAVGFRLPNLTIEGKGVVKELEVDVFSTEATDTILLHKLLERTRTQHS